MTMTSTRPRPTPRRAASLAALVALLVALPGALLSGASAASTDTTGWIRVGHLSPDTPKAEVRLTPFAGGETQTLTEAEFGDLSSYERVPVGLYTVSLVEADAPDATAMLSRNVEITEGGAATVVATGEADQVRATVLQDDLTPPADGQAKVRLISAATQTDDIEASVTDGPVLARGLATGTATGYADVDAQTWDIELSAGDSTESTTSRVPVEAGGVYTLVALDAPQGGLELSAVLDSGSSTSRSGAMPSGGVDAGAGGLADTGAAASAAWTLPAGGLLLVGLGVLGAVALRRSAAA
jgi:hypothetical protein